ncbi:FMN reductase [Devosia rhodophyticola]|uniref:FMN reductase n=1 Tax=Devosia rhodophyticola TaxID=3026423 RepID=A0ABY7YXM6_9HYPH|nr:FMN reductase [Devosia rhodophyticola]WDR05922.1 FMN reductase [Devosia rhodophyticola]
MAAVPSARLKIVAISGNTHRPSRSWNLAELIARRVQAHVPANIIHYDIIDAGAGLAGAYLRNQLGSEALEIIEAIERADILVVTSPVYKGSYTGLFKHLFDFVEFEALIGRPVILSASGGGQRHSLMVEHQLRPLFGFFSALTIPTAIYAEDTSFTGGEPTDPTILARIELAATQCAALVNSGATSHPRSQFSVSADQVTSERIVPLKR